jgi:hypothetical protein
MAAFAYMELCTIAAYGWGWLRTWNVLDLASYLLQARVWFGDVAPGELRSTAVGLAA